MANNSSGKVVGNFAKRSTVDSDEPSFDKYKVESSLVDEKRSKKSDDVIFKTSPISERDLAIDNEAPLKDIVNYDAREDISYGTTLDLSKYLSLKTVKVGKIEGTLILPAGVTEFECADVINVIEKEKNRVTHIEKQVESDEENERDSDEWSASQYDREDLDAMKLKLAKKDHSKIPTIDLRNCTKLTTIKVGSIEGNMSILLPNPSVIKNLEFQNISSGNTLDLTSCSSLTIFKAKNIKRKLKLPLNIESLECRQKIPPSKHCSKLKILKVGKIGSRSLDVSPSIENFECEDVTDPLSLSFCSKLKTVKVGGVQAKIELPPTVQSFECGYVGYQSPLDLRHCSNLTKVTMGSIARMPNLPPSVKIFQYEGNICLSRSPIDLRHCSNLIMVKVGDIGNMGSMLLPSRKVELRSRNVDNQTIDLTNYPSLNCVQLGKVCNTYQGPFGDARPLTATAEYWLWLFRCDINKTSIQLPPNITYFVCQGIQYGATVDLSQCTGPLKVIVNGDIEGTLKLPRTTTSFECKNISYSTTFLGRDLRNGAVISGLDQCTALTTVKVENIYNGTLKLPDSVNFFMCNGIYSSVVDLSQCEKIASVAVKYSSGTLILPRTDYDFVIDIPKGC